MAQPARTKTSRKSSHAVALRPSNGGALQTGNPGNKGGPGVPPSLIRTELRGDFFERRPILKAIADGEPMVKTRIVLGPIAPLLNCPNCGELGLEPKSSEDAVREIEVLTSATPKDRIAALDLMAKYGVGALKEISVENVRERVQQTLAVIRTYVAPELVERMLPELRQVWA